MMDLKVNSARNVETAHFFSQTKKVENEGLIFGNSPDDKTPGVDPKNVIKVPNVGVDVKTKYVNPKDSKSYLSMNDIALILVKEGPQGLKNVKDLKIEAQKTLTNAVMYAFDDFLIEYDKSKNDVNVVYFNDKHQMKMFKYKTDYLQYVTDEIKRNSPDSLKVK